MNISIKINDDNQLFLVIPAELVSSTGNEFIVNLSDLDDSKLLETARTLELSSSGLFKVLYPDIARKLGDEILSRVSLTIS